MRKFPVEARPPRDKRYGWFRQYNDFPTHPKWAVAASLSCVDKCRVIAIVTCLEVAANKGKPRGCIANFSVVECAVALSVPIAEVRRVYKTLEDIGWIDREYVPSWDDRQPDKEDPTNSDRQKRFRPEMRLQRSNDSEFSNVINDPSEHRNTVTSVTVTPDSDSDVDKEETTVTPIPGATVSWAEACQMREEQRNLPWGPVGQRKKGVAG